MRTYYTHVGVADGEARVHRRKYAVVDLAKILRAGRRRPRARRAGARPSESGDSDGARCGCTGRGGSDDGRVLRSGDRRGIHGSDDGRALRSGDRRGIDGVSRSVDREGRGARTITTVEVVLLNAIKKAHEFRI